MKAIWVNQYTGEIRSGYLIYWGRLVLVCEEYDFGSMFIRAEDWDFWAEI